MVLEKLPDFPGDEPALQSIETGLQNYVQVYEWKSVDVVLGRGNRLDAEVHLAKCQADGVQVLRRKGGGGAVVLMPGVWIITACYHKGDKEVNIPQTLDRIVLKIADALNTVTGCEISIKGMGDLCLADKKILGSSLYVGRGAVLYQGSLLVAADLPLISKYLKHPSKEPAYRQGRSHDDFVINLSSAAPGEIKSLENQLVTKLNELEL